MASGKFTATVAGAEKGQTLIAFLARRLDVSVRRARELIDSRRVFVNGRRVWMRNHELKAGDAVEAPGAPAAAGGRALAVPRILYEDADFLVVDKPAGVLTNGPDSAEEALRSGLGPELRVVHRLDRDTTGCLLVAKRAGAFEMAEEIFRAHTIRKTYHAIVAGRLTREEGEIKAPMDGQTAVTRYRTLDATDEATHVLAMIATGRTHQVRRHFLHIRHPVLGDTHYGTRDAVADKIRRLPRQMLHASALEFTHPRSGERVHAKSALPSDFRAALRLFRLT